LNTVSQSPLDAALASIATAERHIETEYQDDLTLTLATVTAEHPRYAMMPTPGRIEVVTDSAGVRAFYESSRAIFKPAALRIRTQIATDWYFFLEGVASRRDTRTGEEFTINTVTLFPAAPDGIVGEFLWERHEAPPGSSAGPAAHGARTDLPVAAVRSLTLHDELLDALRAGDLEALTAPFAEDFLLANRSYVAGPPMVKGEGRAAARDYWDAFLRTYRVEDVAVVNRNATEWYVFAEEALTVSRRDVADGSEQFRVAVFYPLTANGRIQGELGYGTDLAPADTARSPALGRAFYGRPEYVDPLREARS
jgi:SnoaL-like domain